MTMTMTIYIYIYIYTHIYIYIYIREEMSVVTWARCGDPQFRIRAVQSNAISTDRAWSAQTGHDENKLPPSYGLDLRFGRTPGAPFQDMITIFDPSAKKVAFPYVLIWIRYPSITQVEPWFTRVQPSIFITASPRLNPYRGTATNC